MRTTLVLACFFLSGAASLIHEICWIRAASLLLGSTAYALGTVLAVFFLGLAVGSWALGEATRRMARPLRAYAGLELGVAAWAAVSLPLLHALTPLYGAAYRAAGGDALAAFAARVGVLVLVVLPPAVLMGGTLPVLCRQFAGSGSGIGRRLGGLYALNTLGGAVGCAAGGLLLIPALGMQRTVWWAAAANAVCGASVLWLGRTGRTQHMGPVGPTGPAGPARPAEPTPTPSPARSRAGLDIGFDPRRRAAVGALFFVCGLVALGQEVLWTRLLALLIRSSATTATLSLSTVLLGIVLGSGLAALLADALHARARALGALMALNGITALVLTLLPPAAWSALGGRTLPTLFALLLPTAVLSGACFPLALRLIVDEPRLASVQAGRLTAWNTLGGIGGSLLFAFVLLPTVGLQASARIASGLAVAGAGAAWLWLDHRVKPAARAAMALAAIAAWAAVPRLLSTRVPHDHLAPRAALAAVREGREANLAVVRRDDALMLEIDRWWQGQDRPTHQIMAAHLPMLVHPAARSALVVGVGAGQTPERFTFHEGLQRLDAVDIEPAVFDLIEGHFASGWMHDPRVRLLREDGRGYLMHGNARYDIVSLEVGQISRPGVSSFYTREMYRAVRAQLAPGGIVSQFVPLAFLTPEAFRAVLATFLAEFPHATLWYNTGELLLLGSADREPRLDVERMASVLTQPRVADDLQFSHWGGAAHQLRRPAALVGCFLCAAPQLRELAADAPALLDDRPVLEQAARGADEAQARELALVPLIRRHLSPLEEAVAQPRSLPADTVTAAAAMREANLGDVVASALLRRVEPLKAAGDLAGLRALLGQALAANPQSAQALRLMGDVLLLAGDAAGSLAVFQQAAALRPDDALTARGLGMAMQRSGDRSGAIAQYKKTLSLREADAEVHNNLGVALAQGGDLAAAEEHFARAVQLQPDYADALRNLERTRGALDPSRATPPPGSQPAPRKDSAPR